MRATSSPPWRTTRRAGPTCPESPRRTRRSITHAWRRSPGAATRCIHAILDAATGRALGLAAYLRIEPAHGCIEVGHLQFGPGLARNPAATEAMALMMARAFDLGYRRYEWKCDSLNAPSRAAALRYGFTFEGIFRNAIVTRAAPATRPGSR